MDVIGLLVMGVVCLGAIWFALQIFDLFCYVHGYWWHLYVKPMRLVFMRVLVSSVGVAFFSYLAYFIFVNGGWIWGIVMLAPLGWIVCSLVIQILGYGMAFWIVLKELISRGNR